MESDPNGVPAHAPGSKLDNGKTQVWLCISGFANALEHVAQTTTVGATKYSPSGWEKVQDGPARYMEAFGRHMLKLGSGEEIDEPTGLRHKAQMIWNLLASLELEIRGENDGRNSAAALHSANHLGQPEPGAGPGGGGQGHDVPGAEDTGSAGPIHTTEQQRWEDLAASRRGKFHSVSIIAD